jgi:hypothetical protein
MPQRSSEKIPQTADLASEKPTLPGQDAACPQAQPDLDISHTLRTQLAIITLLSGNLDLFYERLDDEKRRAMIKDLRKHAHVLNNLAGDILLQVS